MTINKILIPVVLATAPLLFAQDDLPLKPVTLGGFQNSGSITAGYRFTDVNGYQPKYQELFNLNSGFRVLDLSLFGKAKRGESRFADSYSLVMSGMGGEPYSTAQFTVRKNHRYDLRVNLRQSHYYWNRNDSAALPSGLQGLTSNHDWATVRKIGSVSLAVHATNNLRFSFEYYRNTRTGATWSTRSLEYFGASATWGGYARANPFSILAPVNETSNRGTAGVDYTAGAWNLHYALGFQKFESAINGRNLNSPERSINVDDPNTSRELLSNLNYTDHRTLTTPVSEFSYTGKIHPLVLTRGGYMFYRYSGPASLDMTANGLARMATATVVAPYSLGLTTSAHVTEPNHVIDQGFTYLAKEWWKVMADYRYTRFTVDSEAAFRSVNNDLVTTGNAENQWKIGTHTLDTNMVFTPSTSLLIRLGVRLMKSDIKSLEDGLVVPERTKRVKTAWPIVSIHYQPSKMLTLRGDMEEINTGTPYTRVTPHTDIGGRVMARFRPTDKIYVENTSIARNRKLLAYDFRSTIRSNATTINYDVNTRLSVLAGFSYDSFFASDFVSFLRGTAPFTNLTLRDQTVSRVWQTGFRVSPAKGLNVNFTGNYVRTTGRGEIAGEAPMYGPIKFPYATAAITYDVPSLGRMGLQLQRTYYLEEIVPANNFSANLLAVTWTRSF
jgi:hypothetical protein